MPTEPRTMRSDARANRAAILAAAAEQFAERGLDATFEDIAHAAGVGRATLYRHFATRDRLLGALFGRAVDEIERRALEAPGEADPLGRVLRMTVEVLVEHLPVIDTLRAHGPLADEVAGPLRERLSAMLRAPLEQAQAQGEARADLTVDDLRVLIAMLTAAVRPDTPPADRERALALADAAVRAAAATA